MAVALGNGWGCMGGQRMGSSRSKGRRWQWLRLLLCAVVLAASGSALAVRAQDDKRTGPYWEAVREGIAEFDLGHWPEAIALFKRAHALRPTVRTSRALGFAYFEAREYVLAVESLQEALSKGDELDPKTRRETEKLLRRATVFTSLLEIEVRPATAAVKLDGREVAIDGKALRVNAGEHVLTASHPGYANLEQHVRAEGDMHVKLKLDRVDAPKKATGAAQEPPVQPSAPSQVQIHVQSGGGSSDGLLILGWTSVGLAVAGGVTTAILWRMREDGPVSDWQQLGCSNTFTPACPAISDDADDLQTGMAVAAVAGGMFAVVGVTLLAISAAGGDRAEQTSAGLRCGPMGAGALCQGTF